MKLNDRQRKLHIIHCPFCEYNYSNQNMLAQFIDEDEKIEVIHYIDNYRIDKNYWMLSIQIKTHAEEAITPWELRTSIPILFCPMCGRKLPKINAD